MKITRILVPVDFSPASLRAAAFAGDLAKQLGAEIRLATVLDVGDLRVAMKAKLHGFTTNEDVQQKVREWVDGQFDQIPIPKGVKATRAVRRGMIDKEIMGEIRAYEPQLIVMGSAGITRTVSIGSKTEFVIDKAKVPVLVIT